MHLSLLTNRFARCVLSLVPAKGFRITAPAPLFPVGIRMRPKDAPCLHHLPAYL